MTFQRAIGTILLLRVRICVFWLEVYEKCKAQQTFPNVEDVNFVKAIYKPFTPEEISDKCVQSTRPAQLRRRHVRLLFLFYCGHAHERLFHDG